MSKDSSWFLYILQCRKGSLYTGITTDVERRFEEHNSQGIKCAKYLRGKAPLKLLYQESCGTRSEATSREIEVKKLTRAEKFKLVKQGVNP